ncbi:hypothetical protein [Nitratifractor sp.]
MEQAVKTIVEYLHSQHKLSRNDAYSIVFNEYRTIESLCGKAENRKDLCKHLADQLHRIYALQ